MNFRRFPIWLKPDHGIFGWFDVLFLNTESKEPAQADPNVVQGVRVDSSKKFFIQQLMDLVFSASVFPAKASEL